MQRHNRPLTHDERKAAEAAFKGAVYDPKWSEAAWKVYLGISTTMANKRNEAFQDIQTSQQPILAKQAVPEYKEQSRATPMLLGDVWCRWCMLISREC